MRMSYFFMIVTCLMIYTKNKHFNLHVLPIYILVMVIPFIHVCCYDRPIDIYSVATGIICLAAFYSPTPLPNIYRGYSNLHLLSIGTLNFFRAKYDVCFCGFIIVPSKPFLSSLVTPCTELI